MYFCKECGAETSKWSGKCPSCGAWNSLKEIPSPKTKKQKKHTSIQKNAIPISISEISLDQQFRLKTGISELDCVLGGGIVPGMVALIGGEPGIGKSTLMLQLAEKLAAFSLPVLYVSGEESPKQIKYRAVRLHCNSPQLLLLCSTNIADVIRHLARQSPALIVIDSIQSVFTEDIDSAPGSITQLRAVTTAFVEIAKQNGIPIFLIGHITKDGAVAGPKLIEHAVDTVLYFEGEHRNQLKILRATKNRYGSTNEIGIFDMQADGLQEMPDLSQIFIDRDSTAPGSALGCIREGSRVFATEVQALFSSSQYGNPQRIATGFDHKKLAIYLAVIEKNLHIDLHRNDVFIKLAGGIKTMEPSLDLAVIAAIISAMLDKAFPSQTIMIGEVGLNGEVRPVYQSQKMVSEAIKLGYNKIIISSRDKNIRKSDKIQRISQIFELKQMLAKL